MSVCIVTLGTVGYMVIEGWDFIDSVYMTVITLTTVGYSEVHEVSRAGRVFTILLIFAGVGFFIYVTGTVVQFMVEGKIRALLGRRRLDKKINKLKNHYIVCGYGRIGRVICKKLMEKPIDIVAIEKNHDLVSVMDQDGILYISGDASNEIILFQDGIQNAKMLVAALEPAIPGYARHSPAFV